MHILIIQAITLAMANLLVAKTVAMVEFYRAEEKEFIISYFQAQLKLLAISPQF